jgi:hypothetical protein
MTREEWKARARRLRVCRLRNQYAMVTGPLTFYIPSMDEAIELARQGCQPN